MNSMITADWYAMRPFRVWATAVKYMSAGFFACLNNALVPHAGGEYQYNVFVK